MNPAKEEISVAVHTFDDGQIVNKEPDEDGIPSKYRGTAADKRDMTVLGKKQVLRVCILDNCISFGRIAPN